MSKFKRYGVALVSGLLGAAAALTLAVVELHDRPPPARAVNGPRVESPEERRMIFEWCVVFYATIYLSGQIIYKALGASEESEVVARTSGWHMPVLHLAAGLFIMEPFIRDRHGGHNGGLAALLYALIGSALILQALFHLLGNVRRLNRKSPNSGQPQSPPKADQLR